MEVTEGGRREGSGFRKPFCISFADHEFLCYFMRSLLLQNSFHLGSTSREKGSVIQSRKTEKREDAKRASRSSQDRIE